MLKGFCENDCSETTLHGKLFLCKHFDVCVGSINLNGKTLKFGHEGLKFSYFGDPSLSTGAIAKIENTTIHLDKSRSKNRVQGLKNRNSPLTLSPQPAQTH